MLAYKPAGWLAGWLTQHGTAHPKCFGLKAIGLRAINISGYRLILVARGAL